MGVNVHRGVPTERIPGFGRIREGVNEATKGGLIGSIERCQLGGQRC